MEANVKDTLVSGCGINRLRQLDIRTLVLVTLMVSTFALIRNNLHWNNHDEFYQYNLK